MNRFLSLISVIILVSCNNTKQKQNTELNSIIHTITIYDSLPNKINSEIIPLTVYSASSMDVIYQYPSVNIQDILDFYENYSKKDSLEIINYTSELKEIKINKEINPKLQNITQKNSKNSFQISNPIFFDNDKFAFIVVTKWDKFGYFQENSFILKRDKNNWNVAESRLKSQQ